MEKQPIPNTILEAVQQFADPQVAHAFFVEIRFPNGVTCPRMGCGSTAVAFLAKYLRWYCNDCKRQFTAKVGTIFEDSPIGLNKWLPAFWLIASNRNGISSCELARALGVTQKTGWFMLHRLRLAMQNDSFEKCGGPAMKKPFKGTSEMMLVPGNHIGSLPLRNPRRLRRT
jgi:transposase-like protein